MFLRHRLLFFPHHATQNRDPYAVNLDQNCITPSKFLRHYWKDIVFHPQKILFQASKTIRRSKNQNFETDLVNINWTNFYDTCWHSELFRFIYCFLTYLYRQKHDDCYSVLYLHPWLFQLQNCDVRFIKFSVPFTYLFYEMFCNTLFNMSHLKNFHNDVYEANLIRVLTVSSFGISSSTRRKRSLLINSSCFTVLCIPKLSFDLLSHFGLHLGTTTSLLSADVKLKQHPLSQNSVQQFRISSMIKQYKNLKNEHKQCLLRKLWLLWDENSANLTFIKKYLETFPYETLTNKKLNFHKNTTLWVVFTWRMRRCF